MARLCQEGFRSALGCRARALLCVLCWLAAAGAYAQPGPFVSATSELLLQGRPAEGLLILRTGYQNSRLVDADSLVFVGAGENELRGDVLTMNVGVREPHGLGEARIGRFLLATGAVRPVHLDGATLHARAPFGASLEVFGGAPVVRELGSRSFDWVAGGRLSQRLLQERIGVGVSYLQRRDAGELAQNELGADVSLQPAPWLAISALGAWSLLSAGLAEARLNALARGDRGQLELHVSRRVAARLLPATSLFSVISRAPSTELGTGVSYQLYPRLRTTAQAALEGLDNRWGYRLVLRSTLKLTAVNGGKLSGELSRRKLARDGYSAGLVQLELPSVHGIVAHGSFELVTSDHPDGRGVVWPWARAGASCSFAPSWLFTAALGWRASPEYSSDLYAMVRVSWSAQLSVAGSGEAGRW
jgi:hypothetical protein